MTDDREIDAGRLEAWLAGELPADQVAEVEAWLANSPDAAFSDAGDAGEPPIPPDWLHDLPSHDGLPAELRSLVASVKTQSLPPRTPPRTEDAWREVLMPAEEPELLGLLGDYEVLEVIASGGMGIVFKARDPKLERTAALKVLSPELAANATARERFLREARSAAKLEHENILPIYGVHDGHAVPFFAMRHAPGGSLQDAIDRADPRLRQLDFLRSLARQVARALGAAHEAGIVHRDIKPANILLDEGSLNLWVCDFGIARSIEDPSLTYAGSIAGTPQYMSPEQVEGGAVDGRSDLFALGSVLYHCATSGPAFPGDTTASVMRNVVATDPVPSFRLVPKLPKWFHRLLLNLLAKDPRDRFKDARAVVRAIDDQRAPRPRHTRRRRKRMAVALGLPALLAALGFGLLQIPAVALAANRSIAAVTDRDIINTGRLGSHRTLAEAIAHAHAGDVLEFASAGPFRIDLITIPPDKPLTLRAAKGVTPRLEVHEAATIGLTTHSDLRLERLSLAILNPRDRGQPILRVSACRAEIDHCHFVARYQSPNPWRSFVQRTVELAGAGELDIRDSIFAVDQAKAIVVSGGSDPATSASRVTIRNSYLDGLYSLSLDRNKLAQVSFDIDHCLVLGNVSLWIPTGVPIPSRFEVDAKNNIFGPPRLHFWFGGIAQQQIQASLRWRGENNLYWADRLILSNAAKPNVRAQFSIDDLAGWRDFLGQPLETSEERQFETPFIIHISTDVTPASIAKYLAQFPAGTGRGPDPTRLGPEGD